MSLVIDRSWPAQLTRFISVLIVFVIGCAASPAADLGEYGLSGTVGRYPIAMVVWAPDQGDIVAAHYSYASQGKRIPLHATRDGSIIILTEPDGGVFHLQLVTTDQSAPEPLTFYTSTGLVGKWTKDARDLPVTLGLDTAGPHGSTQDCELYPNPPSPPGPHFPNPGCQHTPDKVVLDRCIATPFSGAAAVFDCVNEAMRPCRDDQYDANFCTGNVDAYLNEIIEQEIRNGERMDLAVYHQWIATRKASCIGTSSFSSDGSGYGADITFCMSAERLRLLQKRLRISSTPIRQKAAH